VIYIDPDGSEPNKSQVTSPRNFLLYLQNLESKHKTNARATLAHLGNYRTLGGPAPANKRYLYTRKGGWIDLVHFFGVAAKLDKLSGIERIGAYVAGGFALWKETKAVENNQLAQGSIGTAWSYEDAPSNYLGFMFWKFYYDPDGDLTAQLIQFLRKMWTEEHSYEQQFPQNRSFFPKFTSEGDDEDDWWSEYEPSKQ
jgi:hypothetical protein